MSNGLNSAYVQYSVQNLLLLVPMTLQWTVTFRSSWKSYVVKDLQFCTEDGNQEETCKLVLIIGRAYVFVR